MRSPTLLPIRMNAADTSASSAIADCTPLTVVPRSWTTAEIDTFMMRRVDHEDEHRHRQEDRDTWVPGRLRHRDRRVFLHATQSSHGRHGRASGSDPRSTEMLAGDRDELLHRPVDAGAVLGGDEIEQQPAHDREDEPRLIRVRPRGNSASHSSTNAGTRRSKGDSPWAPRE